MSVLPNQTEINDEESFFITNQVFESVLGGLTSADNTARYSELAASFSSSPGALADGASINVAPFPLEWYSDTNYLYRATICYEWGLATFDGGAPAGNMTLSFVNASGGVLASHNVPFTANIANGNNNIGGVITTVFKPTGGAYALVLLNNTGRTLTTGTILYTTTCFEKITSGFTVIAPA